jgi:hypothetical protein
MSKGLDELRQRKEELLLESEINRQIIAIETSQLKLKMADWKHSLTRVGSIYKWVAPLAGAGIGFLTARKQMHKTQRPRTSHNGNGDGKFNYLAILGPIGASAVKQAIQYWRHRRGASSE